MRRRFVLGILVALVPLAALMPLGALGQAGNDDPYRAALGKQCPDKHLEWLSPGELDDLIEVNFHDALPVPLQSKLDAADRADKAACANGTAGLACFNAAYLKAMNEVSVLPRFVRLACGAGLICRAPGDCQRQH
jgi:hypothetical protein